MTTDALDSAERAPSSYTGFLVRRAQQAHVAAWQRIVSASISSVQYGVLKELELTPGAMQRDLCDKLDLDRSTVADIVARLEQRALIERVKDPADRRRYAIALTARGQTELRELEPRVLVMDMALTAELDPAEVTELRRLLLRVIATNEPS